METKKIWESKTFWFNLITVVLMVIELVRDMKWFNPEIILFINGLINIVLRVYFTGKSID